MHRRHAHLDKYESGIAPAIAEIEQHKILTINASMEPSAYAKNKASEKQTRWVVNTFKSGSFECPGPPKGEGTNAVASPFGRAARGSAKL